MDFPHGSLAPFNAICTLAHADSIAAQLKAATHILLGGAASAAQTANMAWFYPFRIWETATAVKMSFIVGATNTGNVDVGIYTSQKHRLVNSGSTALGTANTIQEFDITDTLLLPGVYYMAIQFSSSSGTAFQASWGDENLQSLFPMFNQAVGSFGLPNPAAWAHSTSGSNNGIALAVHFESTI